MQGTPAGEPGIGMRGVTSGDEGNRREQRNLLASDIDEIYARDPQAKILVPHRYSHAQLPDTFMKSTWPSVERMTDHKAKGLTRGLHLSCQECLANARHSFSIAAKRSGNVSKGLYESHRWNTGRIEKPYLWQATGHIVAYRSGKKSRVFRSSRKEKWARRCIALRSRRRAWLPTRPACR